MDKIFEMLGIEKLDESKQTKLKETLQTVIDLKSQEIAESKVETILEEEKSKLTEEYETKFGEYKDSITTRFSNFVDTILDEEMIIPENVVRYAHLGELYEGLIDQFKTRLAIDEGMISKEVKDMLKEAKDEIQTLRSKLDEKTGKTLELEKDAAEMAAQLYIRKKCEGLVESQKKRVVSLIGDEVVKENIDKKFKLIVESMKLTEEVEPDGDETGKDTDNDDDGVFEMKCEDCGNVESVKEDTDAGNACSECGGNLVKTEAKNEGKGHLEVGKNKQKVNEDQKPWDVYKQLWMSGLKREV